jgi:uncharacterized protein with FMN-binding domain
MQETASNRNRIIISSVAVIIAIAIIGLSVVAANNNKQVADNQITVPDSATNTSVPVQPTPTAPAPTAPAPAPTLPATSSSPYKNGTYTATGTYSSPGSNHERITITVTLSNGVITSTSAKQGAQEQEGREYQAQFIGGYKSLIVGKSIDSVHLNRVSGSSLTSNGFNSAISQIKQQAKA